MAYLNVKENEVLKNAKERIRALFHPLRQNILKTIKNNGNEMNVTSIYRKLKIEQSVASQHLAILRKQGFVDTRREGKVIYYSVNENAIKECLNNCSMV